MGWASRRAPRRGRRATGIASLVASAATLCGCPSPSRAFLDGVHVLLCGPADVADHRVVGELASLPGLHVDAAGHRGEHEDHECEAQAHGGVILPGAPL